MLPGGSVRTLGIEGGRTLTEGVNTRQVSEKPQALLKDWTFNKA